MGEEMRPVGRHACLLLTAAAAVRDHRGCRLRCRAGRAAIASADTGPQPGDPAATAGEEPPTTSEESPPPPPSGTDSGRLPPTRPRTRPRSPQTRTRSPPPKRRRLPSPRRNRPPRLFPRPSPLSRALRPATLRAPPPPATPLRVDPAPATEPPAATQPPPVENVPAACPVAGDTTTPAGDPPRRSKRAPSGATAGDCPSATVPFATAPSGTEPPGAPPASPPPPAGPGPPGGAEARDNEGDSGSQQTAASAAPPPTAAPPTAAQIPAVASSIQPSRLGPLLYPVNMPPFPDRKPPTMRRLVPIMLVPEQRTIMAIRAWQHSAAARSLAAMPLLGQSQAPSMRSGAKSSAERPGLPTMGRRAARLRRAPSVARGALRVTVGAAPTLRRAARARPEASEVSPGHRIAASADQLTGRLVARADRARSMSLVSRVAKPG